MDAGAFPDEYNYLLGIRSKRLAFFCGERVAYIGALFKFLAATSVPPAAIKGGLEKGILGGAEGVKREGGPFVLLPRTVLLFF